MQVIPSFWKAEKILSYTISYTRSKRLLSGEKVSIPAGSVKLMKVRVEGDWRGKGFVISMSPEEQESGRKLVFPEKAYSLSGSVRAI